MKLDVFFATRPIFTFEELKAFLGAKERATSTIRNLLQYHQKQRRILLIRRGLYAVIPKEAIGAEMLVDPYLLASKLANDAVLAYHTALSLHGKNYTMVNHFYYLTLKRPKRNFEFQESTYQAIFIPTALNDKKIGIIQINRLGLPLSITSLERTFVDILDRPYLCLSWEEICRAIESIEYLNINSVIEYTLLLANQTTTAIVGFFLELYQEKWMIAKTDIEMLKKFRPHSPVYLKRSLKGAQKLISSWNLIVPEYLLHQGWEEPHANI